MDSTGIIFKKTVLKKEKEDLFLKKLNKSSLLMFWAIEQSFEGEISTVSCFWGPD